MSRTSNRSPTRPGGAEPGRVETAAVVVDADEERAVVVHLGEHDHPLRAGVLGGVPGVYLDASREFVPWDVAAAELPAAALLTVDVE